MSSFKEQNFCLATKNCDYSYNLTVIYRKLCQVQRISPPLPTHHVKLGLRLVQQVVLLRLCYADEDPKLRVELQDAALQVGNEVAEAPNAANPNNRLQRSRQAITSHVSPRGL